MDAYVSKPFDILRLNQVLATVTQIAAPPDTNPPDAAASPPQHDSSETREATVTGIEEYLQEVTMLTQEQIDKIISAARQSMTIQLDAAQKAHDALDQDALAKAAHTLKGTLLQCGLPQWAELAEKIHTAAQQREPAPDLLANLRQGLTRVLA